MCKKSEKFIDHFSSNGAGRQNKRFSGSCFQYADLAEDLDQNRGDQFKKAEYSSSRVSILELCSITML